MSPSIFSTIRAGASTVMAPRRGSASLALGALWLLAVAACASAPEPRPASTEALESPTSTVEPSTTITLDLRSRPASALRLEVVNAMDTTRGEQLGAQLESFQRCIESYRAPRGFGLASAPQPSPALFEGTLKDLEKEAIRQALAATGGHRKNAAERLGLGLRTLYEKIKEYDLS